MLLERLKVIILLAALGGLPALAASSAPHEPPPWRAWWHRNAPLLVPSAPPVPVSRSEGLEWMRYLARERPALLEALEVGGEPATRSLMRLGAFGDVEDLFTLLDAVARPGREGAAAVLGLGLMKDRASLGHLEALLTDGLAGRRLAGSAFRPVPRRLRLAAALALGLHGDARAYQVLRWMLEKPGLEDAQEAAILVGLSFSGDPSEPARFARCLGRPTAGPCALEAAAVALGRHPASPPSARELLSKLLEEGAGPAKRGAAVALWYAGRAEAGTEGRALKEAAGASPDALTRALSLLSLAGRGDPRCEELLEEQGRKDGKIPSHFALASGLLGSARPPMRDKVARQLHAWKERLDPEAFRAANALMEARKVRPDSGKTLMHLAAGNGTFLGEKELGALLDLAASSGR